MADQVKNLVTTSDKYFNNTHHNSNDHKKKDVEDSSDIKALLK